jgi:UDP-N-acetylglucosamine--N-acetylmuramyl-(pentapeptide) pyrophosphoryl-undecaprenol N-acetylglucosamine transferase
LRKTGFINTIRGFFELPVGFLESLSIIKHFRPDFVLGVGGYASGPTVAAALVMRIPTGIQEQNSVMGTTNRLLARFVDRVFISWDHTEPATAPAKTMLAGNPIREDLITVQEPRKDDGRFHILVFGGSRGARSINLALAENVDALKLLASRISILHQTGERAVDQVKAAYAKVGIEADVREFIHDMGSAYQWSDMVVCRSGASTLAELTAVGKPAIVVPYPYAIGDHQTRNARVLESRGAVRIIRDQDLKNGALVKEILSLVEDRASLRVMADVSRSFGRPDAARTIALEILGAGRSRS